MTESNILDRIPAAVPGRMGQQTAVEQARVVAEVQAAVVVAQQCPRDLAAAVDQMRISCRQPRLAERAFYRFPRGGTTITGPSVYLARELARVFGNIQYGLAELRRDDEHGQSEMQVFAWDVQTNTRSAHVFIVPHKRDKRGKDGDRAPELLIDMRDIYENNANHAARRLREAIFSVLPPWFVEEAKEICMRTLEGGDGSSPRTLPQRIADAVARFGDIGVTVDQMERKLGRARATWTPLDLASLHVSFVSIQRGEITVEDEFPTRVVTADEIAANLPPAPSDRGPWPGVGNPPAPDADQPVVPPEDGTGWPDAATPGGS